MKHYNFGAGPSKIPLSIIKKIKLSINNWEKKLSILDVNHKHDSFLKINSICEKILKDILKIPKNYEILFLEGGARKQFFMIPNNIFCKNAYYIVSGIWSKISCNIAKKYINISILANNKYNKLTSLPYIKKIYEKQKQIFVYYCENETVNGIEFKSFFKNDIPLIADMSSSFLSKKIDINNFDLLYATSQKNLGIPGLTIVIMKKKIKKIKNKDNDIYLNKYNFWLKKKSIFNTPSIFSWYICYLMLKWMKSKGGLFNIEIYNKIKSNLLYNYLDNSNFYFNYINNYCRSRINIPFFLYNINLNKKFLFYASKFNLYQLKGHSYIGGIRANFYNSMNIYGVKKLIYFMQYFKLKHKIL